MFYKQYPCLFRFFFTAEAATILKNQHYMTALAEEGSLTKAAARLSISQPALSCWLSSQEAQIGMPLVIRSRRQLTLTPAGEIYLDGCRKCLAVEARVLKNTRLAGQKEQEKIIVGGSPIRGAKAFAKAYADFHRRYPEIVLDLVYGANPDLISRLFHEEISMALLGSAETSIPGLDYLKFYNEELVMMLPPGHPLSYKVTPEIAAGELPVIQLEMLGDTPILMTKSETSYYRIILYLYRKAGLEANILFRSNLLPLLHDMVLSGVGAALLPRAYYRLEDGISLYTLSPKLITYQGIGLKQEHLLTEPEEYMISLLSKYWGSPYYLHQYTEYFLEQRKKQL